MIYVFLAEGFEEVEAMAPVDILRRGGVEVCTVGVTGKTVRGSHGITVTADITADETNETEIDGIVLPGGMPGTLNLEKNAVVQRTIDFCAAKKLLIGAICAAPSVLGHKGLLNGKKAVCFPGYEKDLTGALVQNLPAVQDGNIVTGWGAGGAFEFGFALLTAIAGDAAATQKLRHAMRCPDYR